MIIHTHRNFDRKYAKLPKKIRRRFDARQNIFIDDPFHPLLNNHHLQGTNQGCRSINITGDFRAIFKQKGEAVTFVDIDTHHNLYDL